jgi:hypothetical protein
MGRRPLAFVTRDQIRDQRRLSPFRSVSYWSNAVRRGEILRTYCDGSGHLRRDRRVETRRSHLAGSWSPTDV